MLTTECDDFRTITDSLLGSRPIDEKTFASVSVLAERMERLKRSNSIFDSIKFSPDVSKLAVRETVSTMS